MSKENSIDMIENCLDEIYKMRKSLIDKKSTRLILHNNKKREIVSSVPINSDKVIPESSSSSLSVIEKMSSYINSKKPQNQPGYLDTFHKVHSESVLRPNKLEKGVRFKEEIVKVSIENSDASPDLHQIVNNFKNEIESWRESKSDLERNDDNNRESFANYLAEKYLCTTLDNFRASPVVTQLRKALTEIIENFATEGVIDCSEIDLKI
jgi:hypothetical protein